MVGALKATQLTSGWQDPVLHTRECGHTCGCGVGRGCWAPRPPFPLAAWWSKSRAGGGGDQAWLPKSVGCGGTRLPKSVDCGGGSGLNCVPKVIGPRKLWGGLLDPQMHPMLRAARRGGTVCEESERPPLGLPSAAPGPEELPAGHGWGTRRLCGQGLGLGLLS